jgi:hypothetical protein
MMTQSVRSFRLSALPVRFWIGAALIAVAWPLNWLLPGLRTQFLFFPLWLGYVLVVDALVWLRKGSSLWTRNPRAFVGLFLVSAPSWWLFELINLRTQNWEYVGREFFTDAQYALLATISFSTVIPAVFGTTELVSTAKWLKRLKPGFVLRPTPTVSRGFAMAGAIMLAAMLVWPQFFFPFVWLSVYFLLEPLNVWLGNRSLGDYTARGDWRPVIGLWIGALICGFFWEMWNCFSYPQWIYFVPYVSFLHVFEMPILGYGGYLPFGMELFALYHLITGLLGHPESTYVQVGGDDHQTG